MLPSPTPPTTGRVIAALLRFGVEARWDLDHVVPPRLVVRTLGGLISFASLEPSLLPECPFAVAFWPWVVDVFEDVAFGLGIFLTSLVALIRTKKKETCFPLPESSGIGNGLQR